ncbi:hypothetical protein JB92DRAFT_2834098 [Gautieria morchelliformis]|nr:hypothetical protein JB92DRAFT_2834098 [Gautieria morchelliformis]
MRAAHLCILPTRVQPDVTKRIQHIVTGFYDDVAGLETTREQLLSQLQAVDKALAAFRVRNSEPKDLNKNAPAHLRTPGVVATTAQAVATRKRSIPRVPPLACRRPADAWVMVMHLPESPHLDNGAVRNLSIVLPVEFTEALSVLTEVSVPKLESLLLGVQSHVATTGCPALCFLPPLAGVTSMTLHGHALTKNSHNPDYHALLGHILTQDEACMLFSPLHCLTHLTHLYLQADQIIYSYTKDPVRLPSVISLDLLLIRDGGIGALNGLDLPALKTLSIFRNGTSDLVTFAPSLRQTYTALRTLKLLDNAARFEALLAPMSGFVAVFPNIEELVFDYHISCLVGGLSAELAEGLPWPHLHTMAVTVPMREPEYCFLKAGIMSSIIALIYKRIASGLAISHLTVPDQITGQVGPEQLRQLRERVHLDISYGHMGASPALPINPLRAWWRRTTSSSALARKRLVFDAREYWIIQRLVFDTRDLLNYQVVIVYPVLCSEMGVV